MEIKYTLGLHEDELKQQYTNNGPNEEYKGNRKDHVEHHEKEEVDPTVIRYSVMKQWHPWWP